MQSRFGEDSPGLERLVAARARYDAVSADMIAALHGDGDASETLVQWRAASGKLADAANAQAAILSRSAISADQFINEMVEINKYAWDLRVDTGTDRRAIATAITTIRNCPRPNCGCARSRPF